jgi:hypothetical protein
MISKSKAIEIIKHAVANGWERKVSALTSGGRQPFAVLVCLNRSLPGNLYRDWAGIYISFRRVQDSNRRAVSLSVRANYYGRKGTGVKRNVWHAYYEIKRLSELLPPPPSVAALETAHWEAECRRNFLGEGI